jgi:hypothetical protein
MLTSLNLLLQPDHPRDMLRYILGLRKRPHFLILKMQSLSALNCNLPNCNHSKNRCDHRRGTWAVQRVNTRFAPAFLGLAIGCRRLAQPLNFVDRREETEEQKLIAQTGNQHERTLLNEFSVSTPDLVEILANDFGFAQTNTLVAILAKTLKHSSTPVKVKTWASFPFRGGDSAPICNVDTHSSASGHTVWRRNPTNV